MKLKIEVDGTSLTIEQKTKDDSKDSKKSSTSGAVLVLVTVLGILRLVVGMI